MRNLKPALALGAICAAATIAPAATEAKVNSHAVTAATVIGGYQSLASGWLTLRKAGSPTSALVAMTNEANTLAAAKYPYVWGGGHGEAGIPSGGSENANGSWAGAGFDCSGSVTAVLVAGALYPIGTPVGNDASVITELLKLKEIVPGAATGAGSVTLYDNPGVHIFMRFGTRYFGTSDGTKQGNINGGPGWMTGKAYDATSKYFKAYHVKPALLTTVESQGLLTELAVSPATKVKLAAELVAGEQLAVGYSLSTYGVATVATVAGATQTTVSGTITSLNPGATTFTLTPQAGSASMSDVVLANYSGTTALTVGESVTVSYMPVLTGTGTVNQAWSVITPTSGGSTGGSGL